MAHGQATSSTATPLSTAVPKLPSTSHQARKVSAAATSTTGTKTPLMRSASRCSRRLVPLGLLHQALQAGQHRLRRDGRRPGPRGRPLPLRVPPVTRAAGPRSTGSGSPVSIDSSTARPPASRRRRRGAWPRWAGPAPARPPARSRARRGRPSSSSGRDTTRAVGGRSAISECMARAARRPGPGLDGPAGDEDGDDERGHDAVQPGGEGAAPAEVDVAAAEGDRPRPR